MRDWISGWSPLLGPMAAVGLASQCVREERVSVGAGPELEGSPIHILHLSDLHFRSKDRAKLRALQGYRDQSFDLVLVTGDFVDEDTEGAAEMCAEALSGFRSRGGMFGVPGNHEYFLYRWIHTVTGRHRSGELKQTERIFRRLEQAGLRWLVNERVDLPDLGVTLMGVGDRHFGNDDIGAVVERTPPNGRLRILMCHNPATATEAVGPGVDLAVCGHTHGGQIRLPLIGPIRRGAPLPRNRIAGLWREEDTVVYVSRGVGEHHHVPVRLFCPPEAAVVAVKGGARLNPRTGRGGAERGR